jgi:hypothetical protein
MTKAAFNSSDLLRMQFFLVPGHVMQFLLTQEHAIPKVHGCARTFFFSNLKKQPDADPVRIWN